MRLTLVLLVGALCLALGYALPLDDSAQDNVQDNGLITLLDLADQPEGHANEGDREARAFCCGGFGRRRRGYGGYGGGYGRGGFGYGGYGRGGYGGYGGYGRGGFGYGGHRHGHRGGYGYYGR